MSVKSGGPRKSRKACAGDTDGTSSQFTFRTFAGLDLVGTDNMEVDMTYTFNKSGATVTLKPDDRRCRWCPLRDDGWCPIGLKMRRTKQPTSWGKPPNLDGTTDRAVCAF